MRIYRAIFIATYLISYVIAELTPEQKQKLQEYFKVCSEQSGATVDAITKTRNGEFIKDPKLNKFYGCMYRKVGLIDDKGVLQVNVLKSKLPKDVKASDVDKLISACKNTKGADVDETAYLLYKCYYEKSPIHVKFW